MEKKKFDVFVVGSGTAGKIVAEKCVAQGLKVAMAENRELGGTCANRGCDPKKVLLGATEIMQRANDLEGNGIEAKPQLNWKSLQKFKKTFTSHIPKDTKKDLKEKNITLFSGAPKFIGLNTMVVNNIEIEAEKIVLATGLVSRKIDIKGSNYLKQSDDFLSLKQLPKKITFLGAGYIGMEFAQMAARASSKVIIIDRSDSALKSFEDDMVSLVTKESERLGIRFVYNAEVTKIKRKGKKFKLTYTEGKATKSIKTNMVFNTAGRIPSIENMDLEAGVVNYDTNGIIVDEYLRSKSNKNVFACGDVADHSLPLSPLSGFEANIVAENLTQTKLRKIKTPVVPSVVFTLPNLASVGYSEEEALSRYKNVIVKSDNSSHWYNNKRINGGSYAYKVLINERTDQIVGAHLVGPEASEIINLFTMAMNTGTMTKEIKMMIFTYPSWSNDIKSMLA